MDLIDKNDLLQEAYRHLTKENEQLKTEMAMLKKCDATGYDRFEAGKSFANRQLKAECGVLRSALQCLVDNHPRNLVGKGWNFARETLTKYKGEIMKKPKLIRCSDPKCNYVGNVPRSKCPLCSQPLRT